MGVEINVSYAGELRCDAMHGPSGATLSSDATKDNDGRGGSFSPTDLVATALGTCVLTILGLVAERHRLDIRGAKVRVTSEMITSPVRRIGSLRTIVAFPKGMVEDPSMRARMEAAARKCPVHRSLNSDIDAPIEFVYED
jgi:putative redox protein